MRNYTSVKSLTPRLRPPRLGKIRLGVKATSQKGTQYPKEVPHFVVPPEVALVFGEEPTELDVMLISDSREVNFPVAYTWYGANGAKCKGDGETASRLQDDGSWKERSCTCDMLGKPKGCKLVGHLFVMIPAVSIAGAYQISTSSSNSIIDVQSGMAYIEAVFGRSCALIPLKLKREPIQTNYQGKKATHYTMKLTFDESSREVVQHAKLRLGNSVPSQDLLTAKWPEEERKLIQAVDLGEKPADTPQIEIIEEPPVDEQAQAHKYAEQIKKAKGPLDLQRMIDILKGEIDEWQDELNKEIVRKAWYAKKEEFRR